MTVMGWQHLWAEAMALCAQEPPPIQIALLLAVAFTALMVLEGLRANFLPRRKEPARQSVLTNATGDELVRPSPHANVSPQQTIAKFDAPQHPYSPARTTTSPKRKPAHSILRTQAILRPTIRNRTVKG